MTAATSAAEVSVHGARKLVTGTSAWTTDVSVGSGVGEGDGVGVGASVGVDVAVATGPGVGEAVRLLGAHAPRAMDRIARRTMTRCNTEAGYPGRNRAPSGRADGAQDEFEFDGGPDRIRTGDLQRDRLACWAATPRVRGECGG